MACFKKRPWFLLPSNEEAKFDFEGNLTPSGESAVNFTLMSYNILAQHFVEIYKNQMYSKVIDHLNGSDRLRRIKDELIEANCDIFCLQELDPSAAKYFNDIFNEKGYENIYVEHGDPRPDGVGLFFKTGLFKLLRKKTIDYNSILSKVTNNETSIVTANKAIIVELEIKSEKKYNRLIVITSHLLYPPRVNHLKLAQLRYLFAELSKFIETCDDEYEVVISGDFNSFPNSFLYKFIVDGKIDVSNCKISDLSRQKNDDVEILQKNQTYLEGIDNNSQLVSLNQQEMKLNENQMVFCHNHKLGAVFPEPDSSLKNYVTTYHDLSTKFEFVDHIFYSKNSTLTPVCYKKIFTYEEMEKIVGLLPNEIIGSDHISVVAGFRLFSKETVESKNGQK